METILSLSDYIKLSYIKQEIVVFVDMVLRMETRNFYKPLGTTYFQL